jgi:hypothetical protein
MKKKNKKTHQRLILMYAIMAHYALAAISRFAAVAEC